MIDDHTSQPAQLPRTWNFFDPDQEYTVIYRRLPHWEQPGASYFVTVRLNDSLPKKSVKMWLEEQKKFSAAHSAKTSESHWKDEDRISFEKMQIELIQKAHQRFDIHLDTCHGECLLRKPEIARIVTESLMHFDGIRYWISDFVIMLNHVHLICTMHKNWSLRKQCGSWMRYSAVKINQMLNRVGAVWQGEAFDHILRSEDQLQYLRTYIAGNPEKANLRKGNFILYQFDGTPN
jgi:REP element-mobilizing transposase RayT